MRFEPASIFMRREFMPWQNEGICGLLVAMFRLCLNTFVLALVLTWIDFSFNKTGAIQFGLLVKLNAIVALTGLVTLRITFLALHNMFAMALFSITYSGRNYEGYVKLLAMVVGVCAVYFVKNRYIAESSRWFIWFRSEVSII
jgi:hypothetical protein